MSSTRLKLVLRWAALLAVVVGLAGCASDAANPAPVTQVAQTEEVTPLPTTPPTEAESSPTREPAPTEGATETPTSAPTPAPAQPTATPETEPVSLANPGFEGLDAQGLPTGWMHSGAVEAALIEDRGRTGARLTHQGSQAFQVETTQVVSGLADGWHTLRAWVRSSGTQEAAFLALRCGDQERGVQIPSTMPGYRWLQVVVSNEVSGGECAIVLHTTGGADAWTSFDDIELVPGRAALSILGADISSLKKSEDFGGVYLNAKGSPADALQVLKDHGMNYARLRVFVDPADGYHNKARLLQIAPRLKELGIKLLVDFHYSDNWADPGKQIKPAAWADFNVEQIKQAVYEHTYDVCSALVAQGTPPDMVQVGNEINAGLLWPEGDYNNFDNMAAYLKEGVRAVKECSPETLIMLHIAEGGDNSLARWWFDNITRREVPFDVIGISYYPYWHGSLPELQGNLNDISERYDKDVIVVETAYAFTEAEDDFLANIANPEIRVPEYAYTPAGQAAMLRDIMSVVRAVPNGRGLGVFWWDATWIAVTGNGWDNTDPASGNAWENQALFDFDSRPLPALAEFLNP